MEIANWSEVNNIVPLGNVCLPRDAFQFLVYKQDALLVACGCFVVGVLWGLILAYLYLRYRNAPA
jgi:hypothetical protein